MEANVWLDHFV